MPCLLACLLPCLRSCPSACSEGLPRSKPTHKIGEDVLSKHAGSSALSELKACMQTLPPGSGEQAVLGSKTGRARLLLLAAQILCPLLLHVRSNAGRSQRRL